MSDGPIRGDAARYEAERLRALYSLGLLDTPPEAQYDELAQLAAISCGTPMGLMTLVDERRQWFKANYGSDGTETPIELSFCAVAIRDPQNLLIVEDTFEDERFKDNPQVTGGPRIRFYAGMPILTPDGYPLGTLCVADTVPRHLTEVQEMTLRVLARQIRTRIELRVQRDELCRALQENEVKSARLRVNDELFRAFMDCSPFLSFIKDEAMRYVFYNRKFADQFGISMEELLGKRDEDLAQTPLLEAIHMDDARIIQESGIVELESSAIGPDGHPTYWKSFKFQCRDSDGRAMLAGIAQDVTVERETDRAFAQYQAQLEEANKMLSRIAVTDALTGLSNRRSFDQRMEVEFSKARRHRRPLSVALLDVDNFKRLNDRFGHATGDTVLRQLAMVLAETVRLSDHAARYGGEEFVVLLPDTDTRAAVMWAERLHKALREFPWEHESVTVSVGVAMLNDAISNGEKLVAMADRALYAAKRAGKNRTVAYGGLSAMEKATLQHTG